MARRTIASLSCLIWLQGCAGALAIEGAFSGGEESLTGSMSRYRDGGTIEIHGSRGTHCTGTMSFANPISASGRLLCDDRRSGAFTLDLMKGKGRGEIDGRPFDFTLDREPAKKRQSLPPAS